MAIFAKIGLVNVDEIIIALFLASAIRLAGPVLLAALGEVISHRAGVLNVGLEGLMLFGAFGAVVGANATGSALVGAIIGAGVACLCGLAFGILVSVLRADQIVAGIGLNILALGVTTLLREALIPTQITPITAGILGPMKVPFLSDLPILGRGFFSQSPFIYGAVLLALVLWYLLRATSPGLALRSVGEGATAADAAGVPVLLVRVAVVAFTGLMAGFGGAYLSLVASGGFFVDNITGGRGYLAIAVTIFGRWNPLWICAAALLFGAADALQYQGQLLGLAVPTPILLMFPFLLALVTWVLLGRSQAAPTDLLRPFVRGQR
jgi:simple sugar transport system permease protein